MTRILVDLNDTTAMWLSQTVRPWLNSSVVTEEARLGAALVLHAIDQAFAKAANFDPIDKILDSLDSGD
jgi:hypothetical protein